jgi:hypothetical protein
VGAACHCSSPFRQNNQCRNDAFQLANRRCFATSPLGASRLATSTPIRGGKFPVTVIGPIPARSALTMRFPRWDEPRLVLRPDDFVVVIFPDARRSSRSIVREAINMRDLNIEELGQVYGAGGRGRGGGKSCGKGGRSRKSKSKKSKSKHSRKSKSRRSGRCW